jgi:hypothetical protein
VLCPARKKAAETVSGPPGKNFCELKSAPAPGAILEWRGIAAAASQNRVPRNGTNVKLRQHNTEGVISQQPLRTSGNDLHAPR